MEVRTIMDGRDIAGNGASFYSPDYVGSGSETKRGLRFSKECFYRLDLHYNVPHEIKILSSHEDATDLWGIGEGKHTENERNSNENEHNSHTQKHENKGENNPYNKWPVGSCSQENN